VDDVTFFHNGLGNGDVAYTQWLTRGQHRRRSYDVYDCLRVAVAWVVELVDYGRPA